MKIIRHQVLAGLVVAIVAIAASGEARPRGVRHSLYQPPEDIFSVSKPAHVRTSHLELDIELDFDRERISGTATHHIVNLTGHDEFLIDTRDMAISSVRVDGVDVAWQLTDRGRLGAALSVPITLTSKIVEIDYETASATSGTSWFTAMQTLGDQAPFFITLVQPDRTRNWIPIQDTPGIRLTWEATVRVPEGLMALMSAPNPTEAREDGVYRFAMDVPMPAYLIALAAGRVEFHALDDRSGIYVEPEIAAEAKWDLRTVPEMMDAAERIMGPYPLERYDILVSPPGFGAGGMENPLLNFINVMGIVDGDFETAEVPRSLTAHELAHTWAGDLVTCATWNDTWLNEGFATYYASRILEEMGHAELGELGHYNDLVSYQSYMEATADSPEVQILHIPFVAGDSPAIFTSTSYRKGGLFLKTLEEMLGRETFDRFGKSWFRRFRLRGVSADDFTSHLEGFLASTDSSIIDELMIDEWIYAPALPANVAAPTSSALWDRVGVEEQRFREGVPAANLDTVGWTSYEHDLFLWRIADLIAPRIVELDAAFGYSSLRSPSIYWLMAVAEERYEPGYPMLLRYLTIGTWNAAAIFQRLVLSGEEGRALAIELFDEVRLNYTVPMQNHIEAILASESSAVLAEAA